MQCLYTHLGAGQRMQVMIMKDHRHDNIVEFYDSNLAEDELWVVMEYLDGGALTSVVQHTRCVCVCTSQEGEIGEGRVCVCMYV